MNQGSIMARMLRLARNRWSRHFEKRKEGRKEKRGGVEIDPVKASRTGTNRLSVNSACVQSLSWQCEIRDTSKKWYIDICHHHGLKSFIMMFSILSAGACSRISG
jgi:hypothetical protein